MVTNGTEEKVVGNVTIIVASEPDPMVLVLVVPQQTFIPPRLSRLVEPPDELAFVPVVIAPLKIVSSSLAYVTALSARVS